jgi:hypothetical protein
MFFNWAALGSVDDALCRGATTEQGATAERRKEKTLDGHRGLFVGLILSSPVRVACLFFGTVAVFYSSLRYGTTSQRSHLPASDRRNAA